MSYLSIESLSKSFKEDKIISDLDAKISKGEFFVVFGPSGSGKTVLLRLLSGILLPDNGNIKMDEKIINELHPEDREISMAFQNFALYPHMKAYDNIASPLRAYKMNESEIDEKVKEVARLLKIEHVLNQFPKELSNGQKQRVCVARAMVSRPKLLIADEPTSYLDRENADLVINLILDASRNFDLSTIIASHDISFKSNFDYSYTIEGKSLIKC